jgi:hypothetical protein
MGLYITLLTSAILSPLKRILPFLPAPPLSSYIDAYYYDYGLLVATTVLFLLLLIQTTAFIRPPRVQRKGTKSLSR